MGKHMPCNLAMLPEQCEQGDVVHAQHRNGTIEHRILEKHKWQHTVVSSHQLEAATSTNMWRMPSTPLYLKRSLLKKKSWTSSIFIPQVILSTMGATLKPCSKREEHHFNDLVKSLTSVDRSTFRFYLVVWRECDIFSASMGNVKERQSNILRWIILITYNIIRKQNITYTLLTKKNIYIFVFFFVIVIDPRAGHYPSSQRQLLHGPSPKVLVAMAPPSLTCSDIRIAS